MELEGIVIKTIPSKDADLIIQVISKEMGKVSMLAKFARKSKRRFSGSFDLFDLGVFLINKSQSELLIVNSFSCKDCFKSIRENLAKMTAATVVCECFDHLTKENITEGSEHLFLTLKLALQAINESDSTKVTLRAAFLAIGDLLNICGYLDKDKFSKPSAKRLYKLLEHVENCAEREVKSKAALLPLIESLRQK